MDAIPFQFLISLEPLGLLYGSSGRFLSAENLTGKGGERFPPDSPTFSGLIASQLPPQELRSLHTAGPFWCDLEESSLDLRLPAPLSLLQEQAPSQPDQQKQRSQGQRVVNARLDWHGEAKSWQADRPVSAKSLQGGWVRLSRWGQWKDPELRVEADPWEAVPHLHPRLQEEQRVSAQEGALFLELAMALRPGVALAYLSSATIPEGCYRFGGEGHLVQLRCHPIPERLIRWLEQPDGFDHGQTLALITPGVWGSRKLSLREPLDGSRRPATHPWRSGGSGPGILTDRPRPWRFRLGKGRDGQAHRRLSRGRWCMPPGSCYALPDGLRLPAWSAWPESWFPDEGFSFKRFGTALAIPLQPSPP